MTVRTRIAPSPTGDPHVGTLYIGLFNFVFAKKFNGKFILRMEDTDIKRSKPIYEENIFKALKWINLHWDEGPDIGGEFGPYRQSERLDIYKEYIKKLINEDKAYKCFATPHELFEMKQKARESGKLTEYSRLYRNLSKEEIQKREKNKESFVIRLKVPLQGECVLEDAIKGRITTPYPDIDDQVLMKSDGYPTYHFANVVDDHLMKITHVIRGDEWISSTPKHILLYEYFGWKPPVFMHMPLLLGKDKRKLSKRRNPVSTFFYRDSGFLPEAMNNFLSLMGYSMKSKKEIYSVEELIEEFDPKRFGTSGAFFDIKKLEWINQKYIIEKLSEKTLLEKIKDLYLKDDFLEKLMPLAHSRIKTFGDFFDLFNFMFINNIPYTTELLCHKNTDPKKVMYILQSMIFYLEDNWSGKNIENASHKVADIFKTNHKKIVMPILFASIMGKKFGPPLFQSSEILGKEKTRARFLNAIEFLGGISNKNLKLLKECLEKNDVTKII
jgi:glutamyl-tRNA synthetase